MTLHLLAKTFKYCVMIHLKVWIAIRRSSSCVSMWWLELNRLKEKKQPNHTFDPSHLHKCNYLFY